MVIHPFFDGKIGYDETLILAIPILECRCFRLRGLEETWFLWTSCDFVEGTMIEALAKQFVRVDHCRENGVTKDEVSGLGVKTWIRN